MATQHIYRLIFLIPANARNATLVWWRANIDPAETFGAGLNVGGGGGAATHYWLCAALTAAELKRIALRLCTLSGITPPADWDTMNRGQRKQWLLGQRPAIRTATGIRIRLSDNDGVWDAPDEELAQAGLKRKFTPLQ